MKALLSAALLLGLGALQARAETPAEPPAAAGAAMVDLTNASPESLTRLRDPFQRPVIHEARGTPKTELERYSVEQFELLGVVTGPIRMRAMVRAPDSRTHVVAEKMRMGNRNGVVKRITATSLVIREKVMNLFGQEEEVDTELKISSRAKEQAGGGG